jgi:hypothetical protein
VASCQCTRAAFSPVAMCFFLVFAASIDLIYATRLEAMTVDPAENTASAVSIALSEFGANSLRKVSMGAGSNVLGVKVADNSSPQSDPSGYRVFDPSSFWYAPIPYDAPLDPNSANFVVEFLRQIRAFYGHAGINTAAYSSPIYVIGADVAAVPVAQWDCHKTGYHDNQLDQMWRAVPIPSYAQAADGTDSEMTVYQPATDTMWEFWHARETDGHWEACWGGRMLNVSKNIGIWPPHYGTTATGLPFMGGQIAVDELRHGAINHAIGIALVEAEHWNIYSWPANRSDGYNPLHLPNRIPEGLRFRLDPSVEVGALQIHPIAKIIARAAQTYGFVVWDKAGAVSLRAENPKRFTVVGQPNPYLSLWEGVPSSKILEGFPWDRLQFLPMDYGRP